MDASTANTIKGRAPLRASQVIRSAMARRGKGGGALLYVYAPKVNRDLVVSSDLEFLKLLDLEGDEDVAAYETDVDRIMASLGEDGYVGSKPDVVVQFRSSRRTMVEVKYASDLSHDLRAQLQTQAQAKAAAALGMDCTVYTEQDARREERFLNDWLQIVVTLAQAKDRIPPALNKQIAATVQTQHAISLGELRALGIDAWDLVFPGLFQLVQSGRLTSDLKDHPLSASTVIAVREEC